MENNDINRIIEYIKYRLDKIEEIYSPPLFTKDSMFYRGLQVSWIKSIEDYYGET